MAGSAFKLPVSAIVRCPISLAESTPCLSSIPRVACDSNVLTHSRHAPYAHRFATSYLV